MYSILILRLPAFLSFLGFSSSSSSSSPPLSTASWSSINPSSTTGATTVVPVWCGSVTAVLPGCISSVRWRLRIGGEVVREGGGRLGLGAMRASQRARRCANTHKQKEVVQLDGTTAMRLRDKQKGPPSLSARKRNCVGGRKRKLILRLVSPTHPKILLITYKHAQSFPKQAHALHPAIPENPRSPQLLISLSLSLSLSLLPALPSTSVNHSQPKCDTRHPDDNLDSPWDLNPAESPARHPRVSPSGTLPPCILPFDHTRGTCPYLPSDPRVPLRMDTRGHISH